uniref:Uncharacterized protein n=1 Tax=Oryza nivara TaxID=4536 RepID=A0A0E0HME0_ORYNI
MEEDGTNMWVPPSPCHSIAQHKPYSYPLSLRQRPQLRKEERENPRNQPRAASHKGALLQSIHLLIFHILRFL